MNLIFDVDPDYFLKNTKDILLDIKSTDHINLFLNSITPTQSNQI
jgi:hypothetical protein